VIDHSKGTESFQIIGEDESSIADENAPKSTTTFSSFQREITGQMKSSKAKSRMAAYSDLNIEKAEIMPTGEILLPNGKIIGHRQFKHVYK